MRKYISKTNDDESVFDALKDFRFIALKPIQRLSYDLEVSLNRLPKHPVGGVMSKISPTAGLFDESRGIEYVFKKLLRPDVHR